MHFLPYATVAALLVGYGLALPVEATSGDIESDDFGNSTSVLEKREPWNAGLLRILPVGASIMWGQNGNEKSGLRQPLKGWLMNDPTTNFDVNFVGADKCYHGWGDPYDDIDCAAYPGKTIWEVGDQLKRSFIYKPNIVIINAGTNNCVRNMEPHRADYHMRNLIQMLNTQDGFKQGTMYIVSTIPPFASSVDAGLQNCRNSVNDQFRRLVAQMQTEDSPGSNPTYKRKVGLVDLDNCGLSHPNDFRRTDGVDDPWHPNDYGYEKIGKCFFDTIMRHRYWISPAAPRVGW